MSCIHRAAGTLVHVPLIGRPLLRQARITSRQTLGGALDCLRGQKWLARPLSGSALPPSSLATLSKGHCFCLICYMANLKPDFGVGGFPPLPPIRSEATRTRIFTHRSVHGRPAHMFEDSQDDPSPDNEMLEFVGDSVLNLVVTSMLKDMYPNLRVGPLTKIRALVVGNPTLASIARMYHLQEQLKLHPAQTVILRASPNAQADVFESYIGGLYVDQGLDAVDAWLQPLLGPYVVEAYNLVRRQHGLAPAPMPLLPGSPASGTSAALPRAYPIGYPRASSAPTHLNSDKSEDAGVSAPARLLPAPKPVLVDARARTAAPSSADFAPIGYLALFNQYIAQQKADVEWVFETHTGASRAHDVLLAEGEGSESTPVWVVRAMMGKRGAVGAGKGRTKKAAKNEAAREALDVLGVQV